MDEKKSLTDKSKKIKPETKNQNIENKNVLGTFPAKNLNVLDLILHNCNN